MVRGLLTLGYRSLSMTDMAYGGRLDRIPAPRRSQAQGVVRTDRCRDARASAHGWALR